MTANQDLSIQAADILVVDDNLANLRMLTEILTKAGYKPRLVEDPQLALEAALAQSPSLILLDVRMQKLDGFEVCRRLKENAHTREIPIIFVSALEDTEARVQGFEVGGVDFISKPLQEAEVLARVKTHLQLRYSQLHLEALVAEQTAEIAESEVRYRNLVENSVVGVYISRADGRILFVNDALVQMYDFDSPEQMMAQGAIARWQDVKDRDRFLNELQQLGSIANFEAESLSHTGRQVSVNISIKQHGDIFFGMVTDITERKEAEQAFLNSEARFRATFEQAAVGIAHVTLDGKFLRLNQKFCDIVGYSPAEMLVRTFQDITHPEDLDTDLKNTQQLLDGEADTYSMEKRYLHKDGEIIWINLTVSLLREAEGETGWFVAVVDDITDRKETEQKLAISEAMLRGILESANDIIVTRDLNNRVTYFNQAFANLAQRFWGITAHIGMDTIALQSSERQSNWNSVILQVLEGEIHTRQFEHEFSEDEIHHYELTMVPVVREGQTVGTAEFIRDITHLVQAREELLLHRDHLETMVEERTAQLQEEISERKKIEADLQTQSNLFESLLDATPDTIEIFDPETLAYIKWNKACTEISGYSDEEFASKHPSSSFFDEDDLLRVNAAIDLAAREGEAIAAANVIAKDGHRIPLEFKISLARDAKGDPLYLFAIGRDITERKQAEEALLASEEKYRDLVERISDVIYRVDMKGQITYLNPAIETFYGVPPEKLEGQSFAQFIHPDDLERMKKNTQSLYTGQTHGPVEYRVIRPSGEMRWIQVTSQPVWDGGQITELQGVLNDVTERKQAEEALLASEEKYRDLIESVSDIFYAFDCQGEVTYVSPAIELVFGISPDEISGQLFVDFILPEDLARAKKNIEKLMQGEPSGLAEYRILNSSGETRWIRVSSSPIIDDNLVTGFQGILSDITEIKHAEITLRESEERLNALFQSMPLPSYYWQRKGDDFMLIDCNLAADEFTNGGASRTLGSSLTELYPDRPDILEDMKRCFTEKITINREMDYTFKSTEEAEAVLAVTYAFASPDLVIVQTEDIKDRKRLEVQLAETAARAERNRLARRLHDDVTQTLFSASVIAESTPRIMEKNPGLGARNMEQLSTMLRGALAEMRTMLIELRPDALIGKSLDVLLRMLVEANRIRIDSPIELVIEGEGTLPEDVTIVFYRIAQEALSNIVKYAEAEEVQINLTQDEDGIQLVVKDNGQGFEPDKVLPGHFGTSIMQERIDQIGGNLIIDSHPDQGTQIQASWSEQNNAQGVNYE